MEEQVLSPSEIAHLQNERKEIDSTIRAIEDRHGNGQGSAGRADLNALRMQSRILGMKIDKGNPVNRHIDKDRYSKEARELEEKIKEGMPTRDQMWKTKDNPGIVRQQANWERNNAKRIERWKQIQRQLNPGDPTASSVERLRKVK